MSELTDQQEEIVLREQWINLAGSEGADAISFGSSDADVMQALEAVPENRFPTDAADDRSAALGRVARAASQAFQHGASVTYIKNRVVVLLSQSGLPLDRAAKLVDRDRAGFQNLSEEMAAAQREALRLTVDPETFQEQYR